VLRAILAPPTNVRLEHIAAVEVRHLAVGLDPDLVAGVRCDDTQRGDVKTEFPCLGELAQADSKGKQVVACDGGGQVGERFADIVAARALADMLAGAGKARGQRVHMYLHTEDKAVVAAGWVGDEVRDALAAVGGELLEENFCLGFGEGAHYGRLCCV
jgi:hypothetical protein